MKKLLILSVILALCGLSQAQIAFQDTFDHAMDDDWNQINYLEWLTDEHPAGGGWSIGGWDGFICNPNIDTGIVSGMDVENYVAGKNVKYDAPYPLVPYTVDGMTNYWNTQLPGGTYPAPDVHYNIPNTLGEGGYWIPGTEPDASVLNGKLIMKSINGSWENAGDTAPFLYKNWTGNFDAYVEVVSYDSWWYNLGGLMARAANPNRDVPENHIQVILFPMYDGNRISNTVNDATEFVGALGFPPKDYLKLSRRGDTFIGYAGERDPGGEDGGPLVWTLIGEVERPDLPEELQVGIFQNNYIDDWSGEMHFDNFLIRVPEPATIALLGLGALALIRRKR